jgi:hypothetical protein
MKFSKNSKNSKTYKKKSMSRFKTFKKKFKLPKSSTQKAIKKYLSKNHSDYEKYGEILNHFKLFFKAIIDIDNDDLNEKYRIKKDNILSKLNTIELKDPILNHVLSVSPDIYGLLHITDHKIPYYDLIDVYYKVLNKLEEVIEEEEDANLRSEATNIQLTLIDNLVDAFIKNKKNTHTIDDDLLDMFRGMAVTEDVDKLEEMFLKMKVEH